MKRDGQEMLITGQIEHKYEKGKAKRGREKEIVHRKREYIVQKGRVLRQKRSDREKRGKYEE